ncbi:hypothetical protein HanIR_Chr10g0483941 [Helianthus annuus]|nr:hypothetical protein HanIR_Chr10g0483941 [Helianthus annuus]
MFSSRNRSWSRVVKVRLRVATGLATVVSVHHGPVTSRNGTRNHGLGLCRCGLES